MAAPDLETLLDFETNVENAAQIFLATDTGLSTSSINLTLDQDDLELPRLEVRLELSEALDPPDIKTTGSADLEYRKYSGTLSVMVMTRATLDGSEASHRSYRAKVRKSLLLNALNFSFPKTITVSGSGETGANVEYSLRSDPLTFGRVAYLDNTDQIIFWDGSKWIIQDTGLQTTYYSNSKDVQIPPLSGWTQVSGRLPLPTLTPDFVLPYYYDINYLRPTGTDYAIDGDIAASTLTFAINLNIRNDAWPV